MKTFPHTHSYQNNILQSDTQKWRSSECALEGSGDMLPQENFGFLDRLRAFLRVKVRYLDV